MVKMETIYSTDRLQDLWQIIDQLHLSYLEMVESPEKLEHRIRLENRIKDFLCMAFHTQKFYLRETAEVLYQSASEKADFSGYKAATGWNALQMYAGNLLSQPWRKEYRQIKTYCGFYKHQIEANLAGAEIMFKIMGYKPYGNGILMLEGPICPDRVVHVSKDCLIAYVECQITKIIWEEISPTFKIEWQEVLDFRKTHICSSEHAIRALKYQIHEKQYQAQQNAIYKRSLQNAPLQYSQIPSHGPTLPSNVSQIPYIYGTNFYPNNYSTYSYPMPIPCQQNIKPSCPNGYFCNGYLPQQYPVYEHTVPTGQLIEVEAHRNGTYDTVDFPTNSVRNRETVKSKQNHQVKELPTENSDSKLEDWDYVYRNLESQGYSKDLGERGDILVPPKTSAKKFKPTNLDEALQKLTVTDRPLKIVDALVKYEQEPVSTKKTIERRKSQSSSYENLSDYKKATIPKIDKKKSVITKDNFNNNVSEIGVTTSSNSLQKNKTQQWECKHCTYLNKSAEDICEMCSKSRENINEQMEVGGPQCSQCTLVNPKGRQNCQACDASLKDSPTYL